MFTPMLAEHLKGIIAVEQSHLQHRTHHAQSSHNTQQHVPHEQSALEQRQPTRPDMKDSLRWTGCK